MDLKSSNVGQLAGSILSRRAKDYKKRAKRGIAFSLFTNFINEAKKGLTQEKIDAADDLGNQYNPIFERNKEVYNNPINSANRQNYQLYLQKPEEYLHNAAVTRFNSDPDLVRELGVNPWNEVTTENLDTNDYNKAIEIYKAFQNDEIENLENLKTKPFVNKFTLTEYNEAARDAYNAGIELIKNDPTKKNIVKQLWNKSFKTRKVREGNIERLKRRFPEAFKDKEIEIGDVISINTDLIDLTNNLKNKKDLEIAQLNSETLLTTPDNKENEEINNTIEQNNEVNEIAEATYGSSGVLRSYDFTTQPEQLKLNKITFRTKVNKENYETTQEDIGLSVEYNVPIPGFPGLANISVPNRKDLLSAIKKINTNKQFRPLSIEVGLNDSEVRAYALSLNQSPESALNNELKLRKTQAEINAVVKVDPADVVKIYDNKVTRQRVEGSVLSYMSNERNNDTFNYEGNLSTVERNGFVYNVIEGALQLQEINKNLSFDDAILQSIPIQNTGIYKFKDKPLLKRQSKADMFRVEYVNMEVIDFMENKKVNNDRDAKTAVEYLNTKNYIQNRIVNEDTKETLVPAKDKEFTQNSFKFFTINVGDETAPKYLWTYEKLPTQ